MDELKIAQLCHQVNKAYCEAIGDTSQDDWEGSPEWQKESALNGVRFHLSGNSKTPEESHNSWLKEKEADGWSYGETKDTVNKKHPCFVPYEQLPASQKAKDYIFKAICDFFNLSKLR